MRDNRTSRKESVTELFDRTPALDRSAQTISNQNSTCSRGVLLCSPWTKRDRHRRSGGRVKPCSVLVARLSDESISKLLRGSCPKRAFTLHDKRGANGLSSDSKAQLASSTARKGECDGPVQNQVKAGRNPPKVKYPKDMSTVKEVPTNKGALVLTELEVVNASPDKSEELADIINFLIETDPNRSKEAPIRLAAKEPGVKKTSEAEHPEGVQEQSSTSYNLRETNPEQVRGSVSNCTDHIDASKGDVVIQPAARSGKKSPLSREVKHALLTTQETAYCPNDAENGRPDASVVPQVNSDGFGIRENLTADFVLPAPGIYGFTYEPKLKVQSVPGLSSLDSVLSTCKAVKAKFPLQHPEVSLESATMGVVGSSKETSPSAGDHASDNNPKPIDLKANAKDEAAYSTSCKATYLEDTSEPPKTMVSDTLRSSGISEETSDSSTNSSGARLAIEDKNDACPDTDKLATPSPPTYQDTRSRREEDGSCSGARRDDDALGDDQLRTAARPDVDAELASAPEITVSHGKTGSNLKTPNLGSGSVERNTLPVPEDDASVQEHSIVRSEPVPEEEIHKESDVESDETEDLEWAPYTVSTPCNSADDSRECGFEDDGEPVDAGLRSGLVGCQLELNATESKEDSGVPDVKVMSDDEGISTEAVEPRGRVLKQPNLISVFTEIQEGTIISVDCKKFRKRDRPCGSMSSPSKKRLILKKERLMNGSENGKDDEEDIDTVVGEVVRDIVENTVNGSSGLLGEKISTENLKHLFQTFCENNGYRYQDFVSDEAGLNFSAIFGQPLAEMQDTGVKKRRRGSSDHGSSSDHGLEVRTTRKRRKRSTPLPEKRMLTRSQWRRTCNVKSSEEAAYRDGTKNGDEHPETKHGRDSGDASLELYSSNTESSIEVPSANLSQELETPLSKVHGSASPVVELETAGTSSSTASAGQSHTVQLSKPPKLNSVEASLTLSPSQVGRVRDPETVKSPERTDMPPDLEVSDQEEDRLVICDSEDTEHPASVAGMCHGPSVCVLGHNQQQCGAAKSPSLVDELTKPGVPAAVPAEAPEPSAKGSSARVLCESEDAAENTSVVCHSPARADSIETTSVGDVGTSAGFPAVRSDRTLPATVASVSDEDSEKVAVSSSPKTAADKSLGLVVVKEEPVAAAPATHKGAFGAQTSSEEPLDLSVKESTFRPRADIPVGKVHPQMASAHSPHPTSDAPINYSSKCGPSKSDVSEMIKANSHIADAKNHGSKSITRSEGAKEDTGSDSILQRLLLDPNRKPKEPETENPMPVILDVRSLRGSSNSPKDAAKRFRDSDIVAEAKSLLSARLAAKQQSPAVQLPKGSTVASVPPMSFPENKLGMTTLETKIMELKKQIHHLTILATYKEKELACISSLRTAKEDALKQLEHKYPGICSVVRDFGSDSATSEPSSSPGMMDVPTIVTQAATATSLSAVGASDSEPPLHKKLAVQPPLIPAPGLSGIGIPEHESSRRLSLLYERAYSSTPPAFLPREAKQPTSTVVPGAALAKSAFCVPNATHQSHRTQRLLLPKAPAPQQPSNTGVGNTPGANTSALAPSPSSTAAWWNGPNGDISSCEQPSSLAHHLRRDCLREYTSPSSPQFQSVSLLSPVTKQQQQGGAPQRQSSGDPSARSTHRRSRDASLIITEGRREAAPGASRHPEDYGLSLDPAGSASGSSATAYTLNRANIAATSIYNQAMAYSLYQQLRLNSEAPSATQADEAASSVSLLEKMKQNLPPSQQQLYEKSLGSLLEQSKNRPTAWEHLNLLLQKGSMEVPAAALPWTQSGLACINCGDPRVKYVCSCCRTQTFCSEQCQIKLWNKQKTQASTKH